MRVLRSRSPVADSSDSGGSDRTTSRKWPDGSAAGPTGTGKSPVAEARGVLAFVYGTLTDPAQVEQVVEEFTFEEPAVLAGLRRVDGQYPTLAPGDGALGEEALGDEPPTVSGRLLRTDEVATLDAYEGVERGLYVRIAVPVVGQDEGAAVYVGNPDRLGVGEAVDWPDEGSFEGRVRRYVEDRKVVVRPTR